MSTINTSYSSAIGSIQTALSDNFVSTGEQSDIEKQLEALGINTSFLAGSQANVQAELNKMLALLQRLDGGQSIIDLNANITSVDLRTALMSVQMGRANLLEEQLKQQLTDMNERNRQISDLGALQGELRALIPDDGSPVTLSPALIDRLKAHGIDATNPVAANAMNGLIDQSKIKIDSLGATQQQEQIRLQSLTNKRNEAFEMLTNFLSSLQKAQDAIVSNMR